MLKIGKSKFKYQYTHRPPAASVMKAAPKYMKVGTPVPPSVDPRSIMLAPRDQGQEGSCTGHGTSAARELSIAYATGKIIEGYLSPAMTYYLSRLAEGSFPADSGSSVADSMATLQEYGTCPETLLPYDANPSETPSPACYVAATPYRVVNSPTAVNVGDPDTLREVLANKMGVAIGITVYEGALEDTPANGLVPVSNITAGVIGGHEILIVGYLDMNSFLVRNSWSPNWGLGGYCIFQAQDLANITTEAWCIQAEPEQTPASLTKAAA